MDEAGFAVSSRSACETDSEDGFRAPSSPLTGEQERARATLRISWVRMSGGANSLCFARALAKEVAFIDSGGQREHYSRMNIEELSKSQLILLTILVNFVTSVATGILTASPDRAIAFVTQTATCAVERTIETALSRCGSRGIIQAPGAIQSRPRHGGDRRGGNSCGCHLFCGDRHLDAGSFPSAPISQNHGLSRPRRRTRSAEGGAYRVPGRDILPRRSPMKATASRFTALQMTPNCQRHHRRLWLPQAT